MSPYVFSGLGSVAYALIKSDGQVSSLDSLKARYILLEQKPHGVQAINTFLLREHSNATVDEAYYLAMDCFRKHREALTPEVRVKLIDVMEKIVEADKEFHQKKSTLWKCLKLI